VNWLDFVLITVVLVAGLAGLKFGLLRGAITAVCVYVGCTLAGQYSDDIGAFFAGSLSADTLVTVLSYLIMVIGALLVSRIIANIIMPLLTTFTLGLSTLVDRMGGLVVGLLIGLVVAGALIVGMTRLTYNFDIMSIAEITSVNQTPGFEKVGDQFVRVEEAKVRLELALNESQLVPVFIGITDFVPADTFGLVPSDFRFALGILSGRKN